MNPRQQFRAVMSRLRRIARTAPPRQKIIGDYVTIGGVQFSAFVSTERGRCGVELRTARLSERPRRALACDALLWASHYRRAVKASPMGRARNLEAARVCIREAAAYASAFNRLP